MFIINGFYMSMREKYTKAGASIHYYVVEWDSTKTSWEDFRGQVLGATDPATSAKGSLRATVLENWEKFGLDSLPNIGNNGIHGSASPFEAMCERMNWLGAELKDDGFGQALLESGIPAETIMTWTKDPQVMVDGSKASLFDSLEDINSDECIKRTQAIAGVADAGAKVTTNTAFVFIKPHAVNQAVKDMVTARLGELDFKILAEGALDNKTIEDKKLIDNHYYAIANKASLTKPADLNPPAKGQDEFKEKWGLSWDEALKQGLVLNAVDGCDALKIDGEEMNTRWAASKKAKELIKFGGGFYCGKLL